MPSMHSLNRRFLKRSIFDLPDDLADGEIEDVLGVLRSFVRLAPADGAKDGPTRRAPYARPARFELPGSPHTSRVTSPSGDRSFHLAKNETTARTAAEFDRYAWEKAAVLDAELDSDVERPLSAAARDDYMLDHGGSTPDRLPPSLTNLNPDGDIRRDQWNEIEAFERSVRVNPDGKPPKLSIYYERDPDFFDMAAKEPECPEGLRKMIERARRRTAKGKGPGERSQNLGVGWEDDQAPATYGWLAGLRGWRGDAEDVRLARSSVGRGVQTVLAMEGEYFAESDDAARHRIKTGLNDFIQRQRNRGDDPADRSIIPIMIADHLPGRLNDERNVHFHLQMALRRALLSGTIMQFADRKVDITTRDTFIPALRAEFARLSNVELEAIEAPYRLHPGTLEQMGCTTEKAQVKLRKGATVLERSGVPTSPGWSNDLEGWARVMRAAERDHQRKKKDVAARIAAIRQGNDNAESVANIDIAEEKFLAAEQHRYEARRIEILVEMSRSRADRTARFAPAYADEARGKGIEGWRGRGAEATGWLTRLDQELVVERGAIADRMTAAAVMETEAEHYCAQAAGLTLQPRTIAPDPHRAAALIASAPLYLTQKANRLSVLPIDDPKNLVAGADLSSVQPRLEGIYRVQQRELVALEAFVSRHGAEVSPNAALGRPSPWLEGSWRRWQGTPTFERMAAGSAKKTYVKARPAVRELQTLEDFPSLADLPVLGGGIEPFQSIESLQPPLEPSNIGRDEDAALPVQPAPPTQLVPPIGPRPTPAPIIKRVDWTEVELKHRELVEFREQRNRREVGAAIDSALAARVGSHLQPTPLAASLLHRVARGFDPAGVSRVVGPAGVTTDQIAAFEIAVLITNPTFAADLVLAKNRDASLTAFVKKASASRDPYRDGRVKIIDGRVVINPEKYTDAPLRTPRELIMPVLEKLETGTMALTQYAGRTGVYDANVLSIAQDNFVGLLYPDVQARLDVVRRIQDEERRDVLDRVAAGPGSVKTKIQVDEKSGETSTGGSAEMPDEVMQSVLRRLGSEPNFYFACREASVGLRRPAPMQHESALVRAYLAAVDEDADAAILGLMRGRIKAAKPGLDLTTLSSRDRHIIERGSVPGPFPSRPNDRLRPRHSGLPRFPGTEID